MSEGYEEALKLAGEGDLTPLQMGQALRAIRESRELYVTEIHGMDKAQVSRLENGLTDPKLSTLNKYLWACGSDFGELMETISRMR